MKTPAVLFILLACVSCDALAPRDEEDARDPASLVAGTWTASYQETYDEALVGTIENREGETITRIYKDGMERLRFEMTIAVQGTRVSGMLETAYDDGDLRYYAVRADGDTAVHVHTGWFHGHRYAIDGFVREDLVPLAFDHLNPQASDYSFNRTFAVEDDVATATDSIYIWKRIDWTFQRAE